MKQGHHVKYLLYVLACTFALCCSIGFGAFAVRQGGSGGGIFATAQDGAYQTQNDATAPGYVVSDETNHVYQVTTFAGLKTVLTDNTLITATERNVELMNDIEVTESLTLAANVTYTVYTNVTAGAKLIYAVADNANAMFQLAANSLVTLNIGRDEDIKATEHLVTIDGNNKESEKSSFISNTVTSDANKGIHVDIRNAIIENCVGGNVNGAVILLTGANNTLTVHNVTFRNNSKPSASKNGLIYCGAEIIVYDGLFENNEHKGSSGGVFYLTGSNATATIYGGTFRNNKCSKEGGVIKAAKNTVLKVYGGTFENNTAGTNGGVICSLSKNVEIDGTAKFKEDGITRLNQELTFAGNTSANGGIYLYADAITVNATLKNFKASGNMLWDIYMTDANGTKIVATVENVEVNGISYAFSKESSLLTLNSAMSKFTVLGTSGTVGEALPKFALGANGSYENLRVALQNATPAQGKAFGLDVEGKVTESEIPADETQYDITIANDVEQFLTAAVTKAFHGEKVTVTLNDKYNASKSVVIVNGAQLTADGDTYTFYMPAKAAEIGVEKLVEHALYFDANSNRKTLDLQNDALEKEWAGLAGGTPYNDTTHYTTYKVLFEAGSKTPYMGTTVSGDNRAISYRVNDGAWQDVTSQTVKDSPAIIFFEGLDGTADNYVEVKFAAKDTSQGSGAHIKGLEFGKGNKELTFAANATSLGVKVWDDIFNGYKYGNANNTPYADMDALYVYKVTFPATATSPVINLKCGGDNRNVKYRVNGGEWQDVTAQTVKDTASKVAVQGFIADEQNLVEVMFGASNINVGNGANLKSLSFSFTDKEELIHNITIDESESLLETGQTLTLTATVTGGTQCDKTVTWSSSDETIATVANGVVTGVAAGEITITATAADGKTATRTVTVCNSGSAIEGIALDKTTASVKENRTVTLVATITGGISADRTVTWSSSDTSIATVKNGVVTGVKAGTVTITATASDGTTTATCSVTVVALDDAIEKVELNKTTAEVSVEKKITLVATVTGGADCDKTVAWTSSDETIATVENGVVTGVKAGTVTITATASDGKTATCEVTVDGGKVLAFADGKDRLTVDTVNDVNTQHWSGLAGNPQTPYNDNTAYTTYKVSFESGVKTPYMGLRVGGSNRAISYRVNGGEWKDVTAQTEEDKPAIIFFEGLADGETNLIEVKFAAKDTGKTDGAHIKGLEFGKANKELDFKADETRIDPNVRDDIYAGYKYQLASNGTPYADADALYVYKIVFPQHAALPVLGLTCNGDNRSVKYRVNGGEWQDVTSKVPAAQACEISFEGFIADAQNVVEVMFGASNITTGNGANLQGISFKFIDKETLIEKIELDKSTASVEEQSTVKLTATVTGGDECVKTVTWTSSDAKVATVRNGVVTGVKAGTVTITAKAADGKTAVCVVTVTERVLDLTIEKVELDKTTASVETEKNLTLIATVTGGADCDKTVAWTSSDTSIATVENGVVTGVKAGTVTITVTAADGKTATCEVTVTAPEKSGKKGCKSSLAGEFGAIAVMLCAFALILIAKKQREA